jgi:two-component system cell cycle response regulator DivK
MTDETQEKFKVLVFEDNPENQDIIVRRLKKRGYEVHLAEDGQKGLSKLDSLKGAVDVILMDIQMPGMSGLEATEILKANEKTKFIPVIAVSANIDYREKSRYEDIGFHDTFLKPIDFSRLVRVLVDLSSSRKKSA